MKIDRKSLLGAAVLLTFAGALPNALAQRGRDYDRDHDRDRERGGDVTEERGYDRKGDDYNHFSARSLNDCQRSCQREERCQAYTFNERSGDCYLKSRINSQVRDSRMVTGYKEDPGRGDHADRDDRGDRGDRGNGGSSLSEEWGYDRGGNDYRSFDTQSPGDCKRACGDDRRCRAFTYLYRSNTCYLKDSPGYPRRENGAVTGAKEGGRAFNPWSNGLTEELGYDRRGDDYDRVKTRDVQSCKSSCRRDSRCRAYSYIVTSGDCYLKDRINSRDYNPDAITGYKQ